MSSNSEKYRDLLIKQIKGLAQDLDNLAPDLVGNADLMTNFEIHLKFPPDGLPTIELVREHIGSRSLELLVSTQKKE